MLWNDTEVLKIREELKGRLRKRAASSKSELGFIAPRFIFVCGKKYDGDSNSVRELTLKNLSGYAKKTDYNKKCLMVHSIVSERLYTEDIADDIFSFEEMLAEISETIIIPAESPGTFCELGAFVMNKECREKSIVINEANPDYEESFISKGPIKLLENNNEDSVIKYSKPIRNDWKFNTIMESIAKRDFSITPNCDSDNISLKSLIYELANIVEIFQPLNEYEIQELYKEFKGFHSYTITNQSGHKIKSLNKVILLMKKMDLLVSDKCGRLSLNHYVSCFNVMFTLSRKQAMDYRIRFLNRRKLYE